VGFVFVFFVSGKATKAFGTTSANFWGSFFPDTYQCILALVVAGPKKVTTVLFVVKSVSTYISSVG
jgi:hypothetical protein